MTWRAVLVRLLFGESPHTYLSAAWRREQRRLDERRGTDEHPAWNWDAIKQAGIIDDDHRGDTP